MAIIFNSFLHAFKESGKLLYTRLILAYLLLSFLWLKPLSFKVKNENSVPKIDSNQTPPFLGETFICSVVHSWWNFTSSYRIGYIGPT
jgi:hypothetical protein